MSDFELHILNDGSNDNSAEVIGRHLEKDKRIKSHENATSQGLSRGLNYLIEKCSGRYVARMDADDISYPDRFEKQLKILENNEVNVCGTWTRVLWNNRTHIEKYPVTDFEIRQNLIFQSAIAHPTVMLSKHFFDLGFRYNTDFNTAQDYQLWVQLSDVARFYNLPEPLLIYRKHSSQISGVKKIQQWETGNDIRETYLKKLKVDFTAQQLDAHNLVRRPLPIDKLEELESIEHWLITLKKQIPWAYKTIDRNWFLASLKTSHLGILAYRYFVSYYKTQSIKIPLKERLIVIILCLMKVRYLSNTYNKLLFLQP